MIPETYLKILAQHGRPLKDIGSDDLALPRLMALKAINALRGSNVVILGVDVVRIKDGQPEYALENTHCEPEDYTSTDEYLRGSWDKVEQYMINYPDPLDGSIMYSLYVEEIIN